MLLHHHKSGDDVLNSSKDQHLATSRMCLTSGGLNMPPVELLGMVRVCVCLCVCIGFCICDCKFAFVLVCVAPVSASPLSMACVGNGTCVTAIAARGHLVLWVTQVCPLLSEIRNFAIRIGSAE